MSEPMPVDLPTLYMLIGEREVIRYLLQKRVEQLEHQVSALTQVARGNDGGLEQPAPNDAV